MSTNKKRSRIFSDADDSLNVGTIVDLDNSIITIYDEIDGVLSKIVSHSLVALESKKNPIVVKINSGGGYVSDTITICNELMTCNNLIKTQVVGIAYSGAAMIALCGDYVSMASNANLMFHTPMWLQDGNIEEHDTQTKATKEHWYRFTRELLDRREAKISHKDFINNMKHSDWFLNPKQALKLGLINEIY